MSYIDSSRPDYHNDNLPADFANSLPEPTEVADDSSIFLQQLKPLKLTETAIVNAIIDYHQSHEQRTKWSDDGLLKPGELKNYDRRLTRQWEDFKEDIEQMGVLASEEEKRNAANELFRQCTRLGKLPIRRNFIEDYVAKGSYHMLSDDRKIGWCLELLKKLQSEGDAS